MKAHYIPQEHFPIDIDTDIYMLGNYFFNLCLIKGKEASALFEVGISAVVDTVIKQLEGMNIQPDYIICSHPHSDHITGLPGLADKYPNAQIVAAKGAPDFIQHPKAGPVLIREDVFMSSRLKDLGLEPGRPPLQKIPDLSQAHLVDNSQTIDLGSLSLELMQVDGHSPGNLIALVPERGILFCSDSLGFHFPGREFLPLFFTGAAAYLSTLRRIIDMDPSIVCPAHQGMLRGDIARKGIQESFDTTIRLIHDVQESREPDDVLAQGIFKHSYRDEFTLYTRENIQNCADLLVKRARMADPNP